jgi:hypothetical protein
LPCLFVFGRQSLPLAAVNHPISNSTKCCLVHVAQMPHDALGVSHRSSAQTKRAKVGPPEKNARRYTEAPACLVGLAASYAVVSDKGRTLTGGGPYPSQVISFWTRAGYISVAEQHGRCGALTRLVYLISVSDFRGPLQRNSKKSRESHDSISAIIFASIPRTEGGTPII